MFDMPQGVSEAAIIADSCHAEIQIQSQQTASRYNHQLIDSLASAYNEAISTEWLADGNSEIKPATLVYAKEFIESLPAKFQNPTIAPEPDGDLSIEWFAEKRKLLTVSMNSTGRIEWAALFGNEDPRGSIQFSGKTPDTILFYLTRIIA